METTIGGDRLGSGNKQNISLRNYERSTHDIGFVWRSSMAAGTLVPFLNKVGLPGDKFEIDLNAEVLTLPTIGPLFGSYKVQLDVFEIPIRLYNAKLHMNRLGIGMDMKSIMLPQIKLYAANKIAYGLVPTWDDNEQINSSSLIKYLGTSGLGAYAGGTPAPIRREINAVPLLAYWDIYKNYYANKQEEVGYMIHTNVGKYEAAQTPTGAILVDEVGIYKGNCIEPQPLQTNLGYELSITYNANTVQPDPRQTAVEKTGVRTNVAECFESTQWDNTDKVLRCYNCNYAGTIQVMKEPSPTEDVPKAFFGIEQFPLENIDKMRDNILQFNGAGAFLIDQASDMPYSASMQAVEKVYSVVFSQESLGLKTYQSDLFNNWISTEWIDGEQGISALTAVDTSDGNFTIDALNIASKVYDMLNRIAVSGGSYDDWLEAVYTHERVKGVENPVYCGSLIKELSFEEVISTAQAVDRNIKQPLGTLAGRGRLTQKHKGGKITISVNEPSYIMGIVSITPRIDYSQGNEWDINLKTMDDFHKPALDGIGFQDLITEQLLWSDTEIAANLTMKQFSLGKQPAWINYMTSVNKTFGSFAEPENSMFMTLNRRYDKAEVAGQGGKLKDGTTYIDPTKFNNIFAETALSAQNFWVQIACGITARRKMSAKIIPNL
ncbi:MAG: major capsid protein [Microviridae sp.]|nr:MAG: major capsid protein [Microviridae sp.]